jgi:phospholipid transport system substrate-binding protein
MALAACLSVGLAHAAEDPAAVRADSFCKSLVDAVRQSRGQGAQVRARTLQPLVEASFNMRVMAQVATGPAWTAMSPAEQATVVSALTRYSAGRLAQEFDSYSGQTCAIDPAVQARGPDRLVKARIMQPNGEPTALNYRVRAYGGDWKIVDLYYKGVSQLATERADFAAVLRSGGAAGLVSRINELTARMR